MSKGNLIILNGSSSCGKTSTCRAMQDLLQERYILLGLDVYSQATPPKQNNMQTIEPSYFTAERYIKEGLPYFNVTTGPLLDEVICISYQSMAVYLNAGINVISDQLFWSPKWFQAALAAFKPYNVFFVGMFVSDQEGSRRENKRGAGDELNVIEGGRLGGWNRTSAEYTHHNMIYDFEIDNTTLTIEETAKQIISAYKNMPQPMAFKKMIGTHG